MQLFEEESQEDLKAKFHADRAKSVGASEIAVILGISPFKTKYQLYLEKTGKVRPQDLSNNFAVQKGVTWEPVARALFESETGMKFEPNRTMKSPETPWLSCLNDGWNESFKAVLEIKCGGKALHEGASRGEIPDYYFCQVQYEMLCANALIGYFLSFNTADKSMHVVTVHPDLDLQKKLEDAATDFWLNNVIADVAPEMESSDFQSCLDPDFEVASERYKRLKADQKMVQEELDMVETILHGFLGSNSGIKQNGITISRVVRKGNVEYGKIKELEGVDLEPYRKPSTTYIKITGER
jgi:putative phage-type endonuclease